MIKTKEALVLDKKKFKHRAWFLDSNITIKEFLDYVLDSGEFVIKEKSVLKDGNLLNEPEKAYFLNDRRYSYKLSKEEREYLADNDEYFKKCLR